ncbi:MAG: hypothetical protein KKD01_01775 [Proteobacteria bacterium]|nr:hypothetical protein [Pseudomonadota bacterium]MBU1233093.1 hypothetical protein [Pseudomonadota bacterium]MBU1419638.1 hypothetical protein [Pseudomonadota bacterium]MBU1453429.1 hypothetical protein [Pseudomonadota bacterium]
MLIPKEKPYLAGLNSYYLCLDKFIEHLQGEIGSGCLYCQAADQELLVYFDERDIVRAVTQNNGECAQVSQSLEPVIQSLSKKSFLVTIYYLDPSSIFFWGQMPSFQRAQTTLKSTEITLPDLIVRLQKKKFSGFLDINLLDRDDGAILFFHQGERRVGSYSWGKGGGSPSADDYNRLGDLLAVNGATYDIGQFQTESADQPEAAPENSSDGPEKAQYLSDLGIAVKEFMQIFIQVVRKKIRKDPLVPLKQTFLDHIDEYSALDPFRKLYELKSDGTVTFAANVPREEIAAGIVDCAWKVVEDNKLQKKFRAAVNKWDYRAALEERGIDVAR